MALCNWQNREVSEHMEEQEFDPEAMRRLAAEVFRECILRLIACRSGCRPEEIAALKAWEIQAHLGELRWTRWVLAYQQAKETLRNPENLRALLASKLSHTPELGWQRCESEGPLCPKCGGAVDYPKRRALWARIERGLRLEDFRSPVACEALIGTHLTEAEVFRLAGHEVNFSRVEEFARRCYEEFSLR